MIFTRPALCEFSAAQYCRAASARLFAGSLAVGKASFPPIEGRTLFDPEQSHTSGRRLENFHSNSFTSRCWTRSHDATAPRARKVHRQKGRAKRELSAVKTRSYTTFSPGNGLAGGRIFTCSRAHCDWQCDGDDGDGQLFTALTIFTARWLLTFPDFPQTTAAANRHIFSVPQAANETGSSVHAFCFHDRCMKIFRFCAFSALQSARVVVVAGVLRGPNN